MENCVPIIEISDENINTMWPAIKTAIVQSSFIALDCELSGLGNRSKLNCSEIDQRYLNIKSITQEFSIISFGMSCFSCQSSTSFESDIGEKFVKSQDYLVQTFNILTLCSNKFSVESKSLKFLLSHGFDFNKQYSHGLPYSRGEDSEVTNKEDGCDEGKSVKNLFRLIVQHSKPVVFHNGFLDLMFMYQSFYTDLPKNIETFSADLLDMFPAGIYDTKYILEFHQNFPATFLEYVFKKMQLQNSERIESGNWHCRIKFPPYPVAGVPGLKWHYYMEIFDQIDSDSESHQQQQLCESYKFHGWCSKVNSCDRSHNVNRIVKELPHSSSSSAKKRRESKGVVSTSLAQLINIKKQKMEEAQSLGKKRGLKIRKRKKSSHEESNNNKNVEFEEEDNPEKEINSSNCVDISDNLKDPIEIRPCSDSNVCEVNGLSISMNSPCNSNGYEKENQRDLIITNGNRDCQGHSAGYDAFMTGFIFACNVSILGQVPSLSAFEKPEELKLHHMAGKVYLIGKGFPFLIRNSSYGGNSPSHERLIKMLRDVL